jgi:hypothetical protein
MVASLELSVVRIYKQRQTKDEEIKIVGAGFLVSQEYIITCAHVVNESLGFKVTSPDKPTQIIECDFPLITPRKSLETTVEFWLPVKFNSDDPQDIAILKLKDKDSVPLRAEPVSLITYGIGDLSGHSYKAYGFSRNEGVWSDGEIKSAIADNKIQIEDTTQTGYSVESGFSGTAIWDNQLEGVVGMAVMADKEKLVAKSAFFIPTNVLLKAWEPLVNVAKIKGKIARIISLLRCILPDKNYQDQLNIAYKKLRIEIGNSLVDLPEAIPSSLYDFIYQLDERVSTYPSGLKFSYLEIFIGYLILEFDLTDALANLLGENFKTWLQEYVTDWKSLLDLLAVKCQQIRELLSGTEGGMIQREKEPCLLVSITEENKGLRLRSWIIEDVKHYEPTQESPQKRNYCKSLKSNEGIIIKNKLEQQVFIQYLKDVYQEAFSFCQCFINKIQVFLPYKLIEKEIEPIDLLTIDDKPSFAPPPMGKKYEIMVRFSERLKTIPDPESFLWQKKCELLKLKKGNIVAKIQEICRFSQSDPFELYKEIMPEHIIGAMLEILRESDREKVMEAFYYAGIPLALWVREAENFNCQETLEDICKQCQLENLSARLKEKRHDDWGKTNQIGNYLSLLWDDYKLVPPNHLLKMS